MTRHCKVPTECLLTALCLAVTAGQSWGCSRTLPAPTLRQHFAETERVYMARLVSFKSTPLEAPPPAEMTGAIEDASFEVFFVLKGLKPDKALVRIHTEYWGGNCTLSIRSPMEVIDGDGKIAQNPFADVWILFVGGEEPYELTRVKPSRPINMFTETELRLLFSESERERQRRGPGQRNGPQDRTGGASR